MNSSSKQHTFVAGPRTGLVTVLLILWCGTSYAAQSWKLGGEALVLFGGAGLTAWFMVWARNRRKDLAQAKRKVTAFAPWKFTKTVCRSAWRRESTVWAPAAAEHLGMFGGFFAEVWRGFMMKIEWSGTCRELGLTGGVFKRVPKLRHMVGTLDHEVTAYIYPGAVKADVDQFVKLQGKFAGMLRNGCLEVRVFTTGPGNARVDFYFCDPLSKVIAPHEVPRAADDRYLVLGVLRNGKPAVARTDYSLLTAGLPGAGKSNEIHWLIGQLLAKGEWLKVYISDAKGGIELPEYSDHVGEQMGRLKVVSYVTDDKSTVEMLDKVLKDLRIRQQWLAKIRQRKLKVPDEKNPRMIVIIDELLLVPSSLKGADSKLAMILSAGRAGLCSVWAATQDGRVEAIPATIRTRIGIRQCFATNDPELTNAVLGKSAEANGAKCSELDINHDQGVFYGQIEGSTGYLKARAPEVTDAMVAQISKGIVPDEFRRWFAGEGEAPAGEQFVYLVTDPSPVFAAAYGGNHAVYDGRTNDTVRRFGEHLAGRKAADWKWCKMHRRRENFWLHHAKKITVEKIEGGLIEVKRAEEIAIRRDRPAFNHMLNRGSATKRAVLSWTARVRKPIDRGLSVEEPNYNQPEPDLDVELANLLVDYDNPEPTGELVAVGDGQAGEWPIQPRQRAPRTRRRAPSPAGPDPALEPSWDNAHLTHIAGIGGSE